MHLVQKFAAAFLVVFATSLAVPALAQDDAEFAAALWSALAAERMVGDNAITIAPYPREGQAHADLVATLESVITVNGITGHAIAKRSYGAEGATRALIMADQAAYITNVTVMFKRENGYDADNGDWFWAMFMPDGMVGQMEGNVLAGKVGMCSSCHNEAPGGDQIYLHD